MTGLICVLLYLHWVKIGLPIICNIAFLARDVIYTSRAYATMSVSVCLSIRLSVTEVNWSIMANLRFKLRSKFSAHCRRGERSSPQHLSDLTLC